MEGEETGEEEEELVAERKEPSLYLRPSFMRTWMRTSAFRRNEAPLRERSSKDRVSF